MHDSISKAVAVSYSSEFPAPIVVAKGEKRAALKLIELAVEYGIDIEENAELADTLFFLDIGSMIPEELYEVMAEILSFVYLTRSRKYD